MEESQTPTRNQEHDEDRGEEDIDVKKMKVDFMETKQIMDIVKEFEKDYNSSKMSINSYDEISIESNVTIKTVKQCYKTLNDNLYKSSPNFDKVRMNTHINETINEVDSSFKALSVLKGEYFSTNE